MDPLLLTDALRYTHQLAVAVGLGAAFAADALVLSNLRRQVSEGMLRALGMYHTLVSAALLGMWASGLVLLAIRTGLDPANLTPKLMSKLAVVGVLTLNAMVIGGVALPMVRRARGRCLLSLPMGGQMIAAAVAGVSTTSWLLALAMGTSKTLAASGWPVFLALVPAAYLSALMLALLAVAALNLRREPLPG